MALDERESRKDLTDREVTAILGGLIGGLVKLVPDVETLRRAVRWWAETDDAWEGIRSIQAFLRRPWRDDL